MTIFFVSPCIMTTTYENSKSNCGKIKRNLFFPLIT